MSTFAVSSSASVAGSRSTNGGSLAVTRNAAGRFAGARPGRRIAGDRGRHAGGLAQRVRAKPSA
jgi:hypothetical protein